MNPFYIRTMLPSDAEAFRVVARAAGLVAAIDHIDEYLAWQPGGYLVAEDPDGQVVGAVGAQHFGEVAFIGAMCVLPSLQGQGLGRLLMETLLKQLPAHGIRTSLLEATAAGAPLYARLGFQKESVTRVMSGDTGPTRPNTARVHPYTSQELDEVVALDTRCFGAPRTTVLGSWLATYGARSFLCRDASGALCGFISMARNLGPWVARDRVSAEGLLDAALALPREGPARAYVSAENGWACDLLEARGLTEVRTMTRMRLGPPVKGQPGAMLALATAGVG